MHQFNHKVTCWLTSSFWQIVIFIWNCSEALSASDLSVLIGSLGDLSNIVRTIRSELPLEVVYCDGGCSSDSASEPNLKGGISGQFLAPDDSSESRVCVNCSRCYCSAILSELDGDDINCIRCQEHLEVDGISTLSAELGKGLSNICNGEGCSIRWHVVGYDLHVVQVSNWSVSRSNLCWQRLNSVVSCREPLRCVSNFICKSGKTGLSCGNGSLHGIICSLNIGCESPEVNCSLEASSCSRDVGWEGSGSNGSLEGVISGLYISL
jgi:hypothetical protein